MAVVYLLNPENLIIEINQEWDMFASENEGLNISKDDVVGRSILDFVSGKTTKQYWAEMFDRVRLAKAPVDLDYRCDSPSVMRWMGMKLQSLNNGDLRISNETYAIKNRPHPIHFELATQRGKDTFIRCSVCNKLKHKGAWIEPDDLAAKHQISKFIVTYGVCPNH